MNLLPEEIEQFRDKKWRREETRKIEKAEEVEALVEDLGFCLGLTDSRTNLPSVYIAVCGRRDAYAPRNVRKDIEMSLVGKYFSVFNVLAKLQTQFMRFAASILPH